MMADSDQIAVAQPMLADTAAVHEAAVRAAEIDQNPAFPRFHEQILEAAHVHAVEADVAALVAPEHHPWPVERDFRDPLPAARDDQPYGLALALGRLAQVLRVGGVLL